MSPLSVDGYPKKVGKLDLYVCNPAGWEQRMEAENAVFVS
jgi:hypothetical protein